MSRWFEVFFSEATEGHGVYIQYRVCLGYRVSFVRDFFFRRWWLIPLFLAWELEDWR